MSVIKSVTGESLHEDDIKDSIPGATPFFMVDMNDGDTADYTPPDQLPSNPHEYLKSVMHEARNTPDVVVAKIDPSKLKNNKKSVLGNKYTEKQDIVRDEFIPRKEWQEEQLADFATAREEFIRHLAKLKSISRQTKKRPKLPIYPLPPWDDEESWKLLCFGNSLKRRKTVESEDSPTDTTDSPVKDASEEQNDDLEDEQNLHEALAASGRTTAEILADQIADEGDDRRIDLNSLEEGFPPMMRILLRMDANQVEANLEYHASWLEEYGFSHEQGRWIYALLTCLEKPLFPTVISCLRDLSRKCKNIRSKLESPSDHYLNGLNLIICIVGRYFDQTDLADPW